MIEIKFHDKYNFEALISDIEEKAEKDKKQLKKVVSDTGKKVAESAKGYLKKNGHFITGQLENSIKSRCTSSDNEFKAVIKAGASHGIFIEEGTRAHIIKAKKANFLRFYGKDGKPVFVKKVNHPGTKASPFMAPALDDNVPDFIKSIEEVANKWT